MEIRMSTLPTDIPTSARPLLVGILVDVSGSMLSSSLKPAPSAPPGSGLEEKGTAAKNGGANPTSESRIQSVSRALDELVAQGAELSRSGPGATAASLLKVFALGFGFGGILSNVLSAIFGGSRSTADEVRDLLAIPGQAESTVGIDLLSQNWVTYRSNIERMLPDMLGATPMATAFRMARDRFSKEFATGQYASSPVLLVISDGEPTAEDWTEDPSATVRQFAEELKASGVTIISCLLTDDDVVAPRTLHGEARTEWPPGARLLFECASPLASGSPLFGFLREYRWTAAPNARLFAQINHTDVLSEFSKLPLSRLPIHQPVSQIPQSSGDVVSEAAANGSPLPAKGATRGKRVFVSYSHRNMSYLRQGELIDYLSGLEGEGFTFWRDERIEVGEIWDDRIKQEISRCDIALILVSQHFLNSRYCQDTEVRHFIEKRKSDGLRIFPVILSPCDWKSHSWLSDTQVLPRAGTIETHYVNKGKRAELYLEILQQLRSEGR
jgi:hypothetical protein